MSTIEISETEFRALQQRVEQLEENTVTQADLTATDNEGNAWTITDFLNLGLTRRQAITALAFLAFSGGSLIAAIVHATQPANADAVAADVGTQADPWETGYFHNIESGDGASAVTIPALSTDQLNGGVTNSLAVDRIYGERIESQTPSGVAAAEFTTGLTTDYDRYVWKLNDIVPATDLVVLSVEVSTDGGANWKTGASDYRYAGNENADTGSGARFGSQGDTAINLVSSSVGSAAGEGLSGSVELTGPANTSQYQRFSWDVTYDTGSALTVHTIGGGRYDTAEAINGVRFLFASGQIESGEIDLYGVMA